MKTMLTHDAGLSPFRNTALMTWRPCPLCGHQGETMRVQWAADVQFYADGSTPHVDLIDVQCPVCACCYKNPTYTDEGMRVLFAHAAASYGSETPAERAMEQAAYIKARCPTACSVLDIGCGSGEFLRALGLPIRGGVELEPMLSTAIRCNRTGTFSESLDSLPEVFPHGVDVITLWHVLEHVRDPLGLLTTLRTTFCHPNTTLIVEVPTAEHPPTDDICGFLTWMHTTHFDRHTLQAMLSASGWWSADSIRQSYNGTRECCTPWKVSPTSKETQHQPFTASPWAEESRALIAQHVDGHRHACARVQARLDAALNQADGWRPYVLWGAGLHTEMLYQSTSLREHLPVSIVDRDRSKQGTRWRGVPIVAPDAALAFDGRVQMPLVISSYGSQEAIRAAALALGVRDERIVTLYDHPIVY